MTTPALRALKETDPERKITLLASSSSSSAAEFIPEVDRCIVYNAPWMKATALRQTPKEDLAMIKQLSKHRFDAAIIFTVFSQNPLPAALLCYQAGIARRLAHCRENPYQLLTDWVSESEPQNGIRHEVQRQLDLVEHVGSKTKNKKLSLFIPYFVKKQMIERFHLKKTKQPLIVIHPGASAPSRRYPASKFTKVAEYLIKNRNCRVIFTGTKDECELVKNIQRDLFSLCEDVTGRLNFIELTTLISLADVLITNNTGPAHIAAAVGTPIVDLYALTNPQHTPWQIPHRILFHDVPCKYCFKSVCPQGHHDCLERVSWQEVVLAAEELLEEKLLTKSEKLLCTH